MNTTAKILIIDDQSDIRAATASMVKKAGYEALEARSGKEGLEIALSERPDLILIDVVLGEEDGIELCRRIKVEPGLQNTYVALVSGKKLSPEKLSVGRDAGAAEYFRRPISYEDFRPRLRTLLRLQRTEAALRESEEHYRILFEKSPHPTYIADARGTLIRMNQALRDLLDVTDNELVGKYNIFEDNIVAELGLLPQVQEAFENGVPKQIEVDYDSARLKSVPLMRTAHKILDTTITPILDDSGKVRFAYVQHVDITVRREALEGLRLKNLVFDSTISANSIADPNGIVTEANQAFVRLWGYDEEHEVVGNPISHFLNSHEDVERIMGALGQKDDWQGQYVAKKQDGSTFVALSLATTLRNQSGELIGYQSSVVDVTAAMQAEKALQESLASHRQLLDEMKDGLAIYEAVDEGKDFIFKDINAAGEKITNVTKSEIIGKSLYEIRPNIDEFGLVDVLRRVWQTGKPEYHSERFYEDDALQGWFDNYVYKLRSGDIAALFSDNTEHRQAEEALRESEEKYRTLAENIGIGVAMISPEMKILTLNRQMREWFPNIDVSMTPICHQAFNDPSDEVPCSYCPTIKTLKDGMTHQATTETPTAGGIRHYRIVSTPVLGADGEVQAAIEMVEDVTDQVQSEKERASLEEQFRHAQKMESIGRLAGGVAHDFNNLLTVILNYTSLIKESLNAKDPLHDEIDEIDRAGRRAADLTTQLLAFSRKQIIAPRVLDLTSVMDGSENLLRRVIGEDVELFFVLDEQLQKIQADPGQMNQILVNLAVNARDAMPDGGKLTVGTANVILDQDYSKIHPYTKPGPYVMLSISDSGAGMDKDTVDRIFEPFFTTKDVDKGTGLGLSTVYGIVKQAGGSIEVYSEVGHGTTFKIYLPVTEQAEGEELPVKSGVTPGGREAILLIEDETAVRQVARRILEVKGYTVLEAAHPGEALAIAREHGRAFDLVLTDVVMPNMSGKECYRQLREIVPGVKVLFMSGYTASAIVHQGVIDKGMQFIQKPFRGEALARKVREVLDSPEPVKDPPE